MASLDAYVLTFNCARNLIKPSIFGPHLLQATTTNPDLLVLCLQELAPLGYAFLGGSFLTPYFNAFISAVELAGLGYTNVINRNVGLTAIMIFAKEEIAGSISSLETAGVGVGFSETGHKGAVGVRIGFESTNITFVSAHLAPAEVSLEQRNLDYQAITERLVFSAESKNPSVDERREDAPLLQGTVRNNASSGMYSTSHLIFAGDLNYRTSIQPPTEQDANRFPQPTKDHEDPSHWSHLLERDQLKQQREAGKTLQGLQELPIDFAPTYKYRFKDDVQEDGKGPWLWASHRWPSWCDRILYSTEVNAKTYQSLPLFGTSDHRPVAMSAMIPFRAAQKQTAPFQIDSSWSSRRNAARRKELIVGALAYLTWTKEGEALLLASVVGICGVAFVLRSLLTA